MTQRHLVVHIVDDDRSMRESLAALFKAAGLQPHTYNSALVFLEMLPTAEPGCIVSDIRMPEMDGLALQRQLKEKRCTHPLILITGHADIPMAVESIRNGALDFIEKPFNEAVILKATRSALQKMEDRNPGLPDDLRERMASLSPRERDVLMCIVAGHLNKITAFKLGMSTRTVEVHRLRIMRKLGAHTASDLVRLALTAEPSLARAGTTY